MNFRRKHLLGTLLMCTFFFMSCASNLEILEPDESVQTYGTEGELGIIDVDERGRWMVICQERRHRRKIKGKRKDWGAYLILENGNERRIDYFVDSSPEGRYVTYVKNGDLFLLDTDDANEATNIRNWGAEPLQHGRIEWKSAVSFGDEGEIQFIRGKTAVIRNIETGSEKTIEIQEKIYRTKLLGKGRWLLLATMNENDRVTNPDLIRRISECSREDIYEMYGYAGKKTEIYPLNGGPKIAVNDSFKAFGETLWYEKSGGGIYFADLFGRRDKIIPPRCSASTHGQSTSEKAILAICLDKPQIKVRNFRKNSKVISEEIKVVEYLIFSKNSAVKPLGFFVEYFKYPGYDLYRNNRYVSVKYFDLEEWIRSGKKEYRVMTVDFKAKKAWEIPRNIIHLTWSSSENIFGVSEVLGDELLYYNVRTKETKVFEGRSVYHWRPIEVRGNKVIDLKHAKIIGSIKKNDLDHTVWITREKGALLSRILEKNEIERTRFYRGPLWWKKLDPPTSNLRPGTINPRQQKRGRR